MKSIKKAATIFILLLSTGIVFGQQVEATYEIGFDTSDAKVGDTIEIYIKITPPAYWHVYSNKTEGCEYAPLSAELELQKNESFKAIGSLNGIGAKGKVDPIFDCKIWSFDGVALFKQKIIVLSKDLIIKGDFQGQMCDDKVCVPLFPDTLNFSGLTITE